MEQRESEGKEKKAESQGVRTRTSAGHRGWARGRVVIVLFCSHFTWGSAEGVDVYINTGIVLFAQLAQHAPRLSLGAAKNHRRRQDNRGRIERLYESLIINLPSKVVNQRNWVFTCNGWIFTRAPRTEVHIDHNANISYSRL